MASLRSARRPVAAALRGSLRAPARTLSFDATVAAYPEAAVAAAAVAGALVVGVPLYQRWRRSSDEAGAASTELRAEREAMARATADLDRYGRELAGARAQAHERSSELSRARAALAAEQKAAHELRFNPAVRGRHGEETLGAILRAAGRWEEVRWKPTLPDGSQPDAVVSVPGGRCLVVDAKAPVPPERPKLDGAAEGAAEGVAEGAGPSDEARGAYVSRLKEVVSDLGARDYVGKVRPPARASRRACHAVLPLPQHTAATRRQVDGALPRTLLFLPGDGYLRLADLGPEGSDRWGLRAFAAQRRVSLVGPSGLESALGAFSVLGEELAEAEALRRPEVHDELGAISQTRLVAQLTSAKEMGRALGRAVLRYNEHVRGLAELDGALRRTLELTAPRKTSYPRQVDPPEPPPTAAVGPAAEEQAASLRLRPPE